METLISLGMTFHFLDTEEITFHVELTQPKSIDQAELLKQIQGLRFIEGSLSQLR